MATYAPESPTTEELRQLHPLDEMAELDIALARERISGILHQRESGLVAVLGPCAMTAASNTIAAEGEMMHRATVTQKGLYVTHRMPPWKPRTHPEDWHGLETTDPDLAYQTIVRQAMWGSGVSIEIGRAPHAERYAHATVLDWFGGRNIENSELMCEVATMDNSLPLAVKNGLDGEIEPALQHVAELNELRGNDAAPVVLLYRGGENAKDPKIWEEKYRDALEATGGAMIVDIAHGTEMAHDPNGQFKKSVTGQEAALEHVLAIAEKTGETPAGLMAEASGAESPTDPHMSLQIALDGVRQLHSLRSGVTTSVT